MDAMVAKPKVEPFSLKDAPSLIERVWPAQKISVETKREFDAHGAQTLTALGSYAAEVPQQARRPGCDCGLHCPEAGGCGRDRSTRCAYACCLRTRSGSASRLAQIPLRSSHTALQITISDGGEDGRVEWAGGVESTPYLPSRYSIFQSKAQNLTEAAIRKEILKKAAKPRNSKSKIAKKKAKKSNARRSVMLSEAISGVLKNRGA
jgi:hypothetical protein